MSESRPDEYPDGSVGRYVRERWAAREQEQNGSPGIGARRDEAWGVLPDDASWGSDVLEMDDDLSDADPARSAPQPAGEGDWFTERERQPVVPQQETPHTPPHGARPSEPNGYEHSGPADEPQASPRPSPRPVTPPHGTPAQGTPAQGTPAQGTLAQGTPTQTTPAQGTPAQTPAQGTPVHGTPAQGTPVQGSPAQGSQVSQGSDVEGTLPYGTRAHEVATEGAAGQSAAAQSAAAVQNAPAQGGSVQGGSVQSGPAQGSLAQNGPAQDGLAPSTPAPGTPAPGTPAQPAPAQGGSVPSGPTANGSAPNTPPQAPPATPPRGGPAPWTGSQGHGTPPGGAPLVGPPAPAPAPRGQRPIRDVGRWTDPGAVAAQEAQRSRADSEADQTDLSTARLLKPNRRRPPRTGWRRFLYLLTGRLINPGESPQDIRERELIARVNQPLLGCHKIATLSLKGGVGKTTITATLGATFASKRGDRVVAVDANPDRGTLSQKIPLETSATVRHLLRDAQRVRRYTDVRAYTSQGPSRLEVLASEQDPAVSEAFSEDDYRRTVTLLEHFYNVVLTDCGTGLMHSAMYGVLGVADQLIIVSSGSIDGARSASATMDWLEAHHHGDLVRNAVAVINNVHRQAGAVDLNRVAQHFAGRCRAVIQIPFDPHLEEGAEVDLDRLAQPTRIALLELAASVADGFPR